MLVLLLLEAELNEGMSPATTEETEDMESHNQLNLEDNIRSTEKELEFHLFRGRRESNDAVSNSVLA